MNLTKILAKQRELDEAIRQAHHERMTINFITNRLIALLSEIGELANEYAPFKYWKKNKQINQQRLIEEYVDGIHFLNSFVIELKAAETINPLVIGDESTQLYATFSAVIDFGRDYRATLLEKLYALYLGIAQQLNFSDTEIEVAYLAKNAENFRRIRDNY